MIRNLTIVLLLSVTSFLYADDAELDKILKQAEQQEFLEVDQAFEISSDMVGGEVLVRWKIAPGYYLYRHRLAFQTEGANQGEAFIPDGKAKVDPYFGDVEVYYKHLEVSVPVQDLSDNIKLTFEYQGCADAGLCYTPEERMVEFAKGIDDTYAMVGAVQKPEKKRSKNKSSKTQKSTQENFKGERQLLSEILSEGDLIWIALAFFGAGLLLTFTPCVLPMVPILSSIIAGQGKDVTTAKAFKLSFVYVQSMAITYAVFGVLVAQAGSSLSGFLQSPMVLTVVAIIFIALALSMFGLYELQLPQSIQDKLQSANSKQKGGQYLSVALMGILSTLVVSPCTSAPLTAALLLIAQKGSVLTGGFSLYMLGIGMGLPLLAIGVSGGKWLPKAGTWMDSVKAFFGYMMLGLALYIVGHLLPGFVYLGLWAVLFFHAGYRFGAFRSAKGFVQTIRQVLSLLLIVFGLIYAFGALLGNSRLLNPLEGLIGESHLSQQHLEFKQFSGNEQLQAELEKAKQQGKPVMIDFFADWCVACYEFEDFTFKDKRVQDYLSNTDVLLLQADVTENNAQDRALMTQYKVLGLPTILFIDAKGTELTNLRATGFEDAPVFLKRLQAAFSSTK